MGAATEALRVFPQIVESRASCLQNITVNSIHILTASSFMNITFAVEEISSDNVRFIRCLLLTRFVRWNVVLLLPPGDVASPDAVPVVLWCYSILVTQFVEASPCRHASCPNWDVVRPTEFHSSQLRTTPYEKRLVVSSAPEVRVLERRTSDYYLRVSKKKKFYLR